jgi:D-aminopeptidase
VRARELGIEVGSLEPGPLNAITDVAGVRVGHTTLIEGDDIRTGVTVIVPGAAGERWFAAAHRLNGNGEVTGLEWIRESGFLTTPIAITNTFSVGVVRDALVTAAAKESRAEWHLPVVGETYDGVLNDIAGMHVRSEHVFAALDDASDGPVAEGAVGGGTGMISHGFKGGIGTASRLVDGFTVGVLVQANHGRRERLQIDGVPVGRRLGDDVVPLPPWHDAATGSIIVVAATDAPLLAHQCERLAQRCALGIGRTGGAGEDSSGDFIVAFATGNEDLGAEDGTVPLAMLPNERMNGFFYGAIEATEEAIVNALLAAKTMTGRGGATVHGLEADTLTQALRL